MCVCVCDLILHICQRQILRIRDERKMKRKKMMLTEYNTNENKMIVYNQKQENSVNRKRYILVTMSQIIYQTEIIF